MAAARVTIIDQVISDDRKQELANRISDALLSPEDDVREQTQWFVIAEAVRKDAEPSHGPDRRLGSLDFGAWYAHLSGARRWVPDGAAEL